MSSPPADLAASLTRGLRAQPCVQFGVLYGSHAAGQATPVSDLDVGAYVDEAGNFLAVAAALNEAMVRATRFPDMRVDFVDLKTQPSLVYYEILASGRLLFTRDDSFFRKEKLRVMREYLDFRPTYERMLDAMEALRYGMLEATQIIIDVACAVVSHENLGHPKSYAECLRILGREGRLEKPLAERLARAVGLRNVLVHDYLDVNDRLVFEALEDLDDLRAFAAQITRSGAGGNA